MEIKVRSVLGSAKAWPSLYVVMSPCSSTVSAGQSHHIRSHRLLTAQGWLSLGLSFTKEFCSPCPQSLLKT